MTLFRLDRAGALQSPPINIQSHPLNGIRIIARLSSLSLSELGFYHETLVEGHSPGEGIFTFRSEDWPETQVRDTP